MIRDPKDRTEVAQAKRFVKQHGQNIRWVQPWKKWLLWDGKRWTLDAETSIELAAKSSADAVWQEVGSLVRVLDDKELKELRTFAKHVESFRGVEAVLKLARSEPGISILPSQLDANPWLLNCANGTIDLRTGKLKMHDRADLITKLCPVDYPDDSGERECPIWLDTVRAIMQNNSTLLQFLQRILGMALVGKVVEHVMPIFYGPGSNGKSLLLETIMAVIGDDYAGKVPSDMLMASYGDRHPTEIADLFGKRLAVATETDDGRRLKEGLIKELTGGDTVKARRMREDFWQFTPSHTLILATNHKPTIAGTDHGIWRRLLLVPFAQKFWDASRGPMPAGAMPADKQLPEKLATEYPGILAWLVEGCLEWQRHGLQVPGAVQAATAEYRDAEDVLGEFIADRCTEDPNATCKASDLRKEYEAWCHEHGHRPVSGQMFGRAINERGFTKRRSSGVWYDGLGLVKD